MRKGLVFFSISSVIAVCTLSFAKNGDPDPPQTAAALGRLLFFDPILSKHRSLSCASCHLEKYAFADTSAVSVGESNKKGTRNSPSAMNVAGQGSFFWDGRARSLEEQALIPIANPDEMGLPVDSAVARLRRSRMYRRCFTKLFNQAPNQKNLGIAIALFERTLDTNNTPFDDWQVNENENAISQSAKLGYSLFTGKARCSACHFGGDFNNGGVDYRNIGLFDGKSLRDSGRAVLTKKMADLGRFKIPNLRNVAITAPYMHNGLFRTLRQVIDYYNDPDKVVPGAINRDRLVSALGLTETEKEDLVHFLETLTDKQFTRN